MIVLSGVIVLGIFCQWLAWRVQLPAILPLIITGLMIGPFSTLVMPDGQPLFSGDDIFSGDLLFAFVSLSVGLILFEGGMTLRLKEIQKQAVTVRNILTIGLLIVFVGSAVGGHFIVGFGWKISLLFGALVTVSGPTVITPILRNINARKKINTILKWEGILIDPLGALLSVLAYEFAVSEKTQNENTLSAVMSFFTTMTVGIAIGLSGGLFLAYLMRKDRLPDYLRNTAALALVILVFVVSHQIMPESGLLATTVMGIFLANMRVNYLREILSFKEDISLLLISVLFLLLSSRIKIADIHLLGWPSLVLFLIAIFIIRPTAIFASTINSNLSLRERLFISWIGPKGIVAVAVSSLFTLEIAHHTESISEQTRQDATKLLPLVFLFVVGTVILQGGTAKWAAKFLKIYRRERKGFLILGAHTGARTIAKFLKAKGIDYLMMDTSKEHVREARLQKLSVMEGNVLKEEVWENADLSDLGYLLALTPNGEINELICRKIAPTFGKKKTFRVMSIREAEITELDRPAHVLFFEKMNCANLDQKLNNLHDIKSVIYEDDNKDFMDWWNENRLHIVPLFVTSPSDTMVPVGKTLPNLSKGDTLYYLND